MKMITRLFQFISIALLLTSCGEELMSKGTLSDSHTGDGIVTMSSESCSGFHFDKPPVDILFVIDNSGSTNTQIFQQKIRSQLSNIISRVSEDFDYHIYIAPLIPEENESNTTGFPILVNNPSSIEFPYNGNIKSINNLDLDMPPQLGWGNKEDGFDRVITIVNENKNESPSDKKVFRKNSHLITVIISTEDDNAYCEESGGVFGNVTCDITPALNQFKAFKSSLEAISLRFISYVPHSDNCMPSHKRGSNYIEMSQKIYDWQNLDDDSKKDTRDICGNNNNLLFEVVNNSIQKVLVGYTYDHWLVSSFDGAINQSEIEVKKKKEDGSVVALSQSSSNGFEYLGIMTNQNTRSGPPLPEGPGPGEPKTGHIIRLNGNAQVAHPECILAKVTKAYEYYGYVALSKEPENLEEVKVVIGGTEISQSTTNGWSYVGYVPSQNVKVVSPTNPSPASPPLYKTGYILKLHGTAIYSNNQTIEVFYKPKSL